MPRVSAFFGIVIFMYWEEADHHRPHFHAEHGQSELAANWDRARAQQPLQRIDPLA